MMDKMLKHVQFARAYLDNVLVHFSTMEEHVDDRSTTLHLLSEHDLRLFVTNCFFGQKSVDLLGLIIGMMVSAPTLR